MIKLLQQQAFPFQQSNLNMKNIGKFSISILLIISVNTIELPLVLGGRVCAALISSFDPIKIDLKFPAVPNRQTDQNFRIIINSIIDQSIVYESQATPQTIIRKSIELQHNVIYQLCLSFESQREFQKETTVYIGFTQTEDFQSLIGTIQIPQQLASEKNLQHIYTISKKLQGMGRIIAKHQSTQRELQDQIVAKNIHKSQRIVTLGVIEILVIILSGVYQIFALRKFLMEKNLY